MTKKLCDALRELRNRHGYLQTEVMSLMREMGCQCSKSALSRWETGLSDPSIEQFVTLCEIYHVTDVSGTFHYGHMPKVERALNAEGRSKVNEYRDLLIDSGKYAPTENIIPMRKRFTPFYENEASAGYGTFLDSAEYEMVEVGDDVPVSANFGVRIRGDSMEPTCHDGDAIWVHQQPVLEDGDLGLFVYNGQSYMKQFSKNAMGVRLISLNPAYKPMVFAQGDELQIMGKVVAITRQNQ